MQGHKRCACTAATSKGQSQGVVDVGTALRCSMPLHFPGVHAAPSMRRVVPMCAGANGAYSAIERTDRVLSTVHAVSGAIFSNHRFWTLPQWPHNTEGSAWILCTRKDFPQRKPQRDRYGHKVQSVRDCPSQGLLAASEVVVASTMNSSTCALDEHESEPHRRCPCGGQSQNKQSQVSAAATHGRTTQETLPGQLSMITECKLGRGNLAAC